VEAYPGGTRHTARTWYASTVPFMGNCYGALRLGKAVREVLPAAKIALGGGFAATT